MKNSDALAETLKLAGINNFFSVTGGAAVHIIDSLVQKAGMKATFHHHEQAAALAADSYARMHNLGLCVVTTGPGVTNALTGLLCSWQDSVPTIYISGQARHALTGLGSKVRQVGTQHLEVIPIVQNMTKKAVMLQPGDNIQEVVSELIEIAQSGRKGPVWLDIPLDLQLEEFKSRLGSSREFAPVNSPIRTSKYSRIGVNEIGEAKRPVLLLGRGLAGISQDKLSKYLETLQVPCVRTWGFHDTNLMIPAKLDFGLVGVSGQRGANKLVSESDLVISLGVRWGQAVVGPLISEFAPNAKIHIIDLDEEEISRIKMSLPDVITHHCSSGTFLECLGEKEKSLPQNSNWMSYCYELKKYNLRPTPDSKSRKIDQYELFQILDEKIGANNTIVIDGGGTVVYCSMQTLSLIKDRRIVIPSASAPMGTGIPHAIGAQVAMPNWGTVLICGDGSFPFNVQELQTIVTNGLPIKMIIVNNNGYLSIQGTQDQFLEGRHLGSSGVGGLEIPNFREISKAFRIKYFESIDIEGLGNQIDVLLEEPNSAILEVFIRDNQEISPRTGFFRTPEGRFAPQPLSKMYPEIEMPSFSN